MTSSSSKPPVCPPKTSKMSRGVGYRAWRGFRVLPVAFVMLLALIVSVSGALAASANFDHCGNGSFNNPDPTPCLGATEWVNGNLNANKAHFFEGDSVAYRAAMDNLTPSRAIAS